MKHFRLPPETPVNGRLGAILKAKQNIRLIFTRCKEYGENQNPKAILGVFDGLKNDSLGASVAASSHRKRHNRPSGQFRTAKVTVGF